MADTGVKERAREVAAHAKRRVGIDNPSAADADGNVGIVRGALRAFGEGDVDGFLDTLREDVDWFAPDKKRFPGGGEASGRAAVKDGFVADVKRTYSSFGFKPDSFVDADAENAVVVFGTFEGESADGGAVDARAVQVWQFKGNEVEAIQTFADSAEFPEVVTEEKQREVEEKQKEKEEGRGEKEEASGEGQEEKDESEDDSES